ncbi:MAG: mycofactocin system FadH/OYE family oxidoreductase 2 [Acidimicrobiales bacterium]
MRRFPLLYSSISLGRQTLRNRIVFAAHLTNFASQGLPSEQHRAYYEERARGGAGLIITEELSVHPSDWPYEKMIHGFNDAVRPRYRTITESVHRHGALIFAQINHNGSQGSSLYSRLPLWAPSQIPDPLFREMPVAISEPTIAELFESYATTAQRAVDCGFDGIELQCSHSSIIRQFLSPKTNHRHDRYGGSLTNRSRILLELINVVRSAIGPTAALGVRLCGDEMIDDGIEINEAVEVARSIEATGQVDYINTSIGVATASLYVIEASMTIPPLYSRFVPATLRRAIDLPIVGSGRIKDPTQAEKALADGDMDLVGMVRAQIADPNFATTAASDHPERIRLCLSCNQECVGRMGLNRWLSCIENPLAGREHIGHLHHDDERLDGLGGLGAPMPRSLGSAQRGRQRVLIAGAGPSGLQAALALTQGGHRVKVIEQRSSAGGMLTLAASLPTRAELGDLVRNQLQAMEDRRIEITFGQSVDLDLITELSPDVLIVATGSAPKPPYFVSRFDTEQGSGLMVTEVGIVLTHALSLKGSVYIFDEIGFHHATSLALHLRSTADSVTIITPHLSVGQGLGVTLDLETWNTAANEADIRQLPERIVTSLDETGINVMVHTTGQTEHLDADALVLVNHRRPLDDLYHQTQSVRGLKRFRLGDALAPRRAHQCVIEGDLLGELL